MSHDEAFAAVVACFLLFYGWKYYVRHRWPLERDDED
jgi:hypothetical protein